MQIIVYAMQVIVTINTIKQTLSITGNKLTIRNAQMKSK